MTISHGANRVLSAITFARHVPFRRLTRRLELSIKRRFGDWFPIGANGIGSTPPRSQAIKMLFPPRKPQVKRKTNDCTLEFNFLGRRISIRGPFDQSLDWTAPGPGEADRHWRMNLHYMEYLETVDDILFARLCTDWVKCNSVRSPGSWRDAWNSYALSIRVVVWMQQIDKRSDRLTAETIDRLTGSVAAQIRHLEWNLETDIGGNHLFKNIKALLFAGVFFEGPEAKRWNRIGRRLLRDELSNQLLADGVHYERSPSYHCQVFADLLECRYVLRRDPLGGALDEALVKMAQVVADLAHPDQMVAQFNDAGLGMAYRPDICLEAFERLFTSTPRPRSVFAFEQAGYYGVRRDDLYFIADCGRIAPDDLPAHSHGDVLSFELSVGGLRMIVDQGVFEYVAGPLRQISRACRSHNTLSFEGTDQADFFSSFRCGRRPNVTVRHWAAEEKEIVLEGSHDGFKHLPGRPVHIRRFEVSGDSIIIRDRIDGSSARAAQIAFLLHPDVVIGHFDGGVTLSRGRVRLNITSTAPMTVEPAMWWPDLGIQLNSRRLTFKGSHKYETRLEVVRAKM